MQPELANQNDKYPSDIPVINLYLYWEIIYKYRKMIGSIAGVIFFLSIVTSLLLPKMYMATTSILPPHDQSPGVTSLLTKSESMLESMAGNLFGKSSPTALYVGILKSRSVADVLIEKFKLKELYKLKYIEDVYKQLQKRSVISTDRKRQIISVSVNDRDPNRAAGMANTYIEALDQINRKINITEGKRKRVFLQERLKEVAADLESAETALKIFQERFNLVSIEEQAKVSIETASQIKGQIIAAQTELNVLKQFGTEKQIEAIMLKTKIEELNKQLMKIEVGKGGQVRPEKPSQNGSENNFYIPFEELPELSMQLMRLTREAKIQEKVFEILTAQFEMAQIEEVKDVDTIQVLDVAVAPQKKISPNRSVIVLISTVVGIFFSVFIAYAFERWGFKPKTIFLKQLNKQ